MNATWNVLGSTTTVNARDNTGDETSCPTTAFQFIVLTANWSPQPTLNSGHPTFEPPINITGTGLTFGGEIWTGTFADGTTVSQRALGNNGGIIQAGLGRQIDLRWVSYNQFNDFQVWPFYAMSSVITVTAVPEPSSIMLLGFGTIALAFSRRRRSSFNAT
ncbi:PEP-CTERM sorting domain-containing protein [Rubripirellula obstinata]|nr:PEP-CTERM sorting domain-containing protein [Rubripirellula obstinata]